MAEGFQDGAASFADAEKKEVAKNQMTMEYWMEMEKQGVKNFFKRVKAGKVDGFDVKKAVEYIKSGNIIGRNWSDEMMDDVVLGTQYTGHEIIVPRPGSRKDNSKLTPDQRNQVRAFKDQLDALADSLAAE